MHARSLVSFINTKSRTLVSACVSNGDAIFALALELE